MERKANKLRTRIAKGELVTGSVSYSWSPGIIEIAGYAGLDFIRVDCEHAWRRDSMAEHLMRSAYIADIVPIMRVDRDDPYMIRKALEIGAGGIIVPDVRSVKEVEEVVKASKFPPLGSRGYSSLCWSAGWGSRAGEEWVQWSNTEPMIGVMIENRKAVEQVDEILAVDGLDFVLFGPADYSMSLGLGKPNKNHEKVQEALKLTLQAAKKHGKPVMFNPGTGIQDIEKYVNMGVTMLEIGNDLAILRSTWANSVREIQALK
ncbi:MAG: 2,4-dihydroxyhept-2-ene-1,7-dioic acid aldolase [Deltaproteobacteria bacterium]|nr:2,4-dihydroxyhept-2-ene-1,7-dioic acid aldolase [Deltaproteobacteria bacterium]